MRKKYEVRTINMKSGESTWLATFKNLVDAQRFRANTFDFTEVVEVWDDN